MPILLPINGNPCLPPKEVIRRVERAFAYVEATSDGARERVQEWMSQLAFVAAGGRAAHYDEDLARLEAAQDDALYACFGDELDERALLSMLMVPGQPLYLEPPDDAPREKTEALIARCAQALGYAVAREAKDERRETEEARGERREARGERRGARGGRGWTGGGDRSRKDGMHFAAAAPRITRPGRGTRRQREESRAASGGRRASEDEVGICVM
jgi:hypothetical protein